MRITLVFFFMATLLTNSIGQDVKFSPDDIDIPYQQFELDNGLRLIVHEDHKAPIVAVNVWYHVGSKNEKPGKSGFAHLFEHLMFNGSEHFDDDYFQALERIGGTDLNGTTNSDRTNYFQNVPVSALDQVLWLESDRMGHLLGAIDQDKLDEQRGVVQNEKRQGENQPYGQEYDLMTKALYPTGHPYSWTVIGEMEDLNAASLDDVHEWFKSYYGAANAVIVIAGDVDANEIHEKVKDYFGHIAPGPTIARQEVNIPIRLSNTRQKYQDRVPEVRITQAWNTPEWGSRDEVHLQLAASVLSSGKSSRLYKELLYDNQLASNVYAYQYSREIAGNFYIGANVKPGVDPAEVESRLNAELENFLKTGPTETELNRAKAQFYTGFIKGLERIGGFGGKSDVLAESEVYGKDPESYKTYLKYLAEATPQEVQKTAVEWLARGKHTLICEPFPEYSTSTPVVDRSTGLPEMGEPEPVTFPDMQKATLKNGMKIVLAQREGVPTVVMRMLFDAGYASDQFSAPGTASIAMDMMDEGTEDKDALEINETLQMLGASIGSYSDLDYSYVTMSTLMPTLDPSLDLYADVIRNPAFPEKEFKRLQTQQISRIKQEQASPVSMAIRIMPKFLYGESHPYAQPLTGSGFVETVEKMKVEDVSGFYNNWIHPNNATLLVVGDMSMDELLPQIEERFGDWKKGKMPKKEMPDIEAGSGNVLYLMDRPESAQSMIISGYVTEPYGGVNEIARKVMVDILGGDFTSRLNMNLREDKHWSYGARTLMLDAKGQRPLVAFAPVQTDKSKESVQEIVKEFKMFVEDKPASQGEFDKVQKNSVLQLPGQWETNNAVASSLTEILKYGLSDDYYQKYDREVRSLQLKDVHTVASTIVKPEKLTWFIVGDKEKILPGLQELGFDKIILCDADGNPIEEIGPSKP